MTEWITDLLVRSSLQLAYAFYSLALPAAAFVCLALLLKELKGAWADAKRAARETRTTLLIMSFNAFFVVPFLAVIAVWMSGFFADYGLHLVDPPLWDWLPSPIVAAIAIFVGDFTGYWRHRLEHTKVLWPAHAVHHSDTEMTWLAVERIHPINRLTTLLFDSAVLLALGFPAYAVVANNLVRHYYGYFVHADLPWTYGPLGKIFVSPAMHRWHHAADPKAFNTNYAQVFSLFDRWFGTYRVPGPCAAPLGVTDKMGPGVAGQLAYPLRPSAYRFRWIRRIRKQAELPAKQN